VTTPDSAKSSLSVLSLRALGGIFLCFLLCFLIISFALPILFESWAPKFPAIMLLAGSSGDPALAGSGVGKLILPWLIFGISLMGLKGQFERQPLKEILQRFGFGPVPSWKVLIGTFAIGILTMQIFTKVLIPNVGNEQSLVRDAAEGLDELPEWLLALITINTFTLVPVAEEFLFRGVLYTGLSALWNKPLSMVVTSAGFIALHPGNLASGNTLIHLAMLVVAVLLVLAREKTGALYVPIMLHAGLNFPLVSIN
jgi:membrane protease YdiL (CAAX protease family)